MSCHRYIGQWITSIQLNSDQHQLACHSAPSMDAKQCCWTDKGTSAPSAGSLISGQTRQAMKFMLKQTKSPREVCFLCSVFKISTRNFQIIKQSKSKFNFRQKWQWTFLLLQRHCRLLCSSLYSPWTTVSSPNPEKCFIPGDKEPIDNQLSLDRLPVGWLLLGVQGSHIWIYLNLFYA